MKKIYFNYIVHLTIMGAFLVSCQKKEDQSSWWSGDEVRYKRTVDATPISLKEALDNYKEYICTEIVLDAHYIRHFEGDWIADSADGKGLTLFIVGKVDCDHYAYDGEYLYRPEGVSSTSALIRGTLHRGTLKGKGGIAYGSFFEDTTYLQIHTVVYPKDAVIQQ